MRFFLFIFMLLFPTTSFACGTQDLDTNISIESEGLHGNCYNIRVLFLEESPSRKDWIWAAAYAKLKAYQNEKVIFSIPLEIQPSLKENTLKTSFCLSKQIMTDAVMSITYEEASTVVPSNNGLIPVSFCNHEVVIDDFEQFISR